MDIYMKPDDKEYWTGIYQWMESDAPAYCAAAIDNGSGDTPVVFFFRSGLHHQRL
jgi:hypothetical protein